MTGSRIALVGVVALALACKSESEPPDLRTRPRPTARPVPKPKPADAAASVPGLAVAVVIDTSGSMREPIAGSPDPKETVARQALAEVLEATVEFLARRPGFPVKVGIIAFSTEAEVVSVMAPYSRARIVAALERVPHAFGETAIGDAVVLARDQLSRSGVTKKHMIVITDGENSMGIDPEAALIDLANNGGGIAAHFVVFDVDAALFGYVKKAHASLLSARRSEELGPALQKLYETRILAEAFE